MILRVRNLSKEDHMFQEPQMPGGASTGTASPPSDPAAPSRKRTRPKKTLPTDRIAFLKQLDILRAHAVVSGEGERVATNIAVGDFVKMSHGTVSLANPFFADVGFLTKSNGSYLPSREVIEFSRAYQWGDEEAAHKLAPRLRDSWFGQSILKRLSFRSTMDEDETLRQLAQEASAGPEYRSQVALLLAFLEAGGLIERDGSRVCLAARSPAPEQPTTAEPTPPPGHDPPHPPNPFVTPQPEGGVNFQVGIQVDMQELRGWEADRIAAFFSGMAQVLAAKGGLEQDTDER